MAEKKYKKARNKPTKNTKTQKSKGLGDTVEKITKATGIKKAVDWFVEATGVDCGCDARKEKLNKLFPYKQPECLTRDEYDFIGTIINRSVLNVKQQVELNGIYNRVFHQSVEMTNCGSCLKERIVQLQAIYNSYEGD
jgi:hypothetical protein